MLRTLTFFFSYCLCSLSLVAQSLEDRELIDIEQIRGVNYYPQQSPWDTFGPTFDKGVLQQDFRIIREMGLNTIRIFVQYNDFENADTSQVKLDKLCQLMDVASQQDLKVIVTLFDFYGDYNMDNWENDRQHLTLLSTTLKQHANLLAWDVKNEPDLDFTARGKEIVLKWLERAIAEIKHLDNTHSVTIGWSNTSSALYLADKVDFVSFHYYEDLTALSKKYTELKSKTTKPVVLQEYGFSSYGRWPKLFGNPQKKQAQYYMQAQRIIEADNIPYLFWTLYDFNSIPEQVVGKKPKHQKKQMRFGILDNAKKQKQAYRFLSKDDGLLYVSYSDDY